MAQIVTIIDLATLKPVRKLEGWTFGYIPFDSEISKLGIILARQGYRLERIELSEESFLGRYPKTVDILVNKI